MSFMQNPGMLRGRAMKSRSGCPGLALLFAVLFTAPLHAQMKIEKTEPAANSTTATSPSQIQIRFNEMPVYGTTKIDLIGPVGAMKLSALVFDGNTVSASVIGVLPDGAYVVRWQTAGN